MTNVTQHYHAMTTQDPTSSGSEQPRERECGPVHESSPASSAMAWPHFTHSWTVGHLKNETGCEASVPQDVALQ